MGNTESRTSGKPSELLDAFHFMTPSPSVDSQPVPPDLLHLDIASATLPRPELSPMAKEYHADDCTCLQRALKVIEKLETQKYQQKPISIDVVLSFQQLALDACDTMLACKDCRILSTSIMVVLMICEKLLKSPRLGWRRNSIGSSTHKLAERRHPQPLDYLGGLQASMGTYKLKTAEELLSIAETLKSTSLKRLRLVLSQMYTLAISQDWTIQVMMITQLQEATRIDYSSEEEI